jgi:hypothetical protein
MGVTARAVAVNPVGLRLAFIAQADRPLLNAVAPNPCSKVRREIKLWFMAANFLLLPDDG